MKKRKSWIWCKKLNLKHHWVYIRGFFSPCCHQNCVQSLFQFLYECPENLWKSVKKVRDWCVKLMQHTIQVNCSMHRVWHFLKNVPGSCSAGMYPILQLWRLDKYKRVSVSNFTETSPVKFTVWGEIMTTEKITNGLISCLTDKLRSEWTECMGKKWWG